MAGSPGRAGGAARDMAPPCCLDNVIIEFRLIESDPDKDKFGFDWLRTPQDQVEEITKHEDAYVDSDWDDSVQGIIVGGYKKWSQEEIDAISYADDTGGHTDLNAYEAQKQFLENEYTDSFEIQREDMFFNYRLKSKRYYVPCLNLFPPVDYLLTEEQITILVKVWKGMTAGQKDPADAIKMQPILNTKRLDVAGIEGVPSDKLSIEDKAKLRDAWAKLQATDGVVNKAKLRLIKDIKIEVPERLTIEYEHQHLKLSVDGGKYIKHEDKGLTELEIPAGHYSGVTATLKEIEKLPVTIETLDKFSGDLTVSVWAYSKNKLSSRRLAGKLIVCASDKFIPLKIACIKVTTNIEKDKKRTGELGDSEIKFLRSILHQALILPEIDQHKLDLSGHPDFKQGKRYVSGDGRLLANDTDFAATIEAEFLKDHPSYANWLLIFAFKEVHIDGFDGNVDSVIYEDNAKNPWLAFRPTCFLYDARVNIAMGHEALHCLKLRHTHNEISLDGRTMPAISAKAKYLFPHAFKNKLTPEKATSNIMSYNGLVWLTWRWQWEIMRVNCKIDGRALNAMNKPMYHTGRSNAPLPLGEF